MAENDERAFASRTKWDVTVAGGGTAGFVAAIAAARAGAHTLLVERYQTLGGMMTGGLVIGIHTMRIHQGISTVNPYQETTYQSQQVVRGIAQEVVDRLIEMGGAFSRKGESSSIVRFDPELLKYLISEMLDEAGVEVWLDSLMTDVVVEDGMVKAILVNNKSGRHLVEADVFIDATGDADLAVAAGAPWELGRPQDGRTMPASMVFTMGGVDLPKLFAFVRENPEGLESGSIDGIEQRYCEDKPILVRYSTKALKNVDPADLPRAPGARNPITHFQVSTSIRGGQIVRTETNHIMDSVYGLDLANASDLSEGIQRARRHVMQAVNFYRKYIPGYENAYLLQTADQLGVRETRRIVGDYVMTAEDVLNATKFPDKIARGGRAMNIHSEDGWSAAAEGFSGKQWLEIKDGKAYDVPYRALLPKDVEGLLVAGRCISVDHMALGSLRGEPLCMATGQAAGVAAALSSQLKVTPRQLDISLIQRKLIEQNADLGGIPDAPPAGA
ncbi:MAG: FAD-dependent oxidoreductase [Bacteroidetes bacterium]|nr:FAD-dependent oxidoreductase [Bacteroidota bacterium]MCL5025149.1 FAD-dependent oxidoreductase [Chloroflexota bacterium]